MITPKIMGITNRTINTPETGWEERTYYIVDIAYTENNVIHRAIFYSGYLQNGCPCGYNAVGSFNNTECPVGIHDVYYMNVVNVIGKLEDF